MAGDFDGPNGLAFSPDERRLYVAETGDQTSDHPRQFIRVFDVSPDGKRLLAAALEGTRGWGGGCMPLCGDKPAGVRLVVARRQRDSGELSFARSNRDRQQEPVSHC